MKGYVYFKLAGHKPRTDVYEVRSKSDDSVLGIVKWYAPWRQYCFFPVDWKSMHEQVKSIFKHPVSTKVIRQFDVHKLLEENVLVFSRGCTRQINAFIDRLMAAHQKKKKDAVKK